MARTVREITELELIGGRVCLDFVNTVSWRPGPAPLERLEAYADLIAWARHAGLIAAADAKRLTAVAARRPRAAARALGQAVDLREALHRVFGHALAGGKGARADMALLNEVLATGGGAPRLAPAGDGYVWRPDGNDKTFVRILTPIAWSAAELLASDQLHRLKVCGADDCGWLFLDLSRNRTRRWCSMADCGNRAKARRHYARARRRISAQRP
jgi:predicted RNA-binding Zn ribbon-like protein